VKLRPKQIMASFQRATTGMTTPWHTLFVNWGPKALWDNSGALSNPSQNPPIRGTPSRPTPDGGDWMTLLQVPLDRHFDRKSAPATVVSPPHQRQASGSLQGWRRRAKR